MDSYYVPSLPGLSFFRQERVIKRSRFLVSLGHADGAAIAKRFIDSVKREFPDASHNCWAFVAGAPGDTASVGYSDDGEPHGTAGRPMLTILLHSGIGEIVAVITRYFGGIKLGTGGLVRAYQDTTRLGLEKLPLRMYRASQALKITIHYPHVTPLRRLLAARQAEITREIFTDTVAYEIQVPLDDMSTLKQAVIEATDGDVVFG